MRRRGDLRSASRRTFAAALALGAVALASTSARADEGGVSYWLPGFYGSLAAAPMTPGWSLITMYYHTSVSGGGDVAFAREVPVGRLRVPLTANINASLNASADLGVAIPQYTFATPILGGQASVGMLIPGGNARTSVNATQTAAIGPLGFTTGAARTDDVTGFSDLSPLASLRWHDGVNNWMTYITGDIPVGRYSSTSLANLGLGHGTVDFGGGYTYLNPQSGYEFSGMLGITYNFINPDTQYQSGVDLHFDWGVSKFLSKQLFVGLVGYAYQQVTCDSGSGDFVGCFESRVLGVGPQIGYLFPVGDMQGYLNLKAYGEFDNAHRPDGWNVWLTFGISPSAPAPASPSHLITK
jgi:hypothetical protein